VGGFLLIDCIYPWTLPLRGGHEQVRRAARTSRITYMFEIAVDVSELHDDGRNYHYEENDN
jgi:hypothetical protein